MHFCIYAVESNYDVKIGVSVTKKVGHIFIEKSFSLVEIDAFVSVRSQQYVL